MISGLVVIAVLAAYASLVIELTAIHVPSVASSRSLWSPSDELLATGSSRLRRVLGLRRSVKLVALAMPLLVLYALYLYPLAVIAVGSDPLGDYLLVPGPGMQIAAVVLMVLGRALALLTAVALRRCNRDAGDSVSLLTAGPFRWSRNPGLVGMYVFVVGMWLAMPSASMLAGIVFYVCYMDFKVRLEEDFLRGHLGEPYVLYQARTGRYFP